MEDDEDFEFGEIENLRYREKMDIVIKSHRLNAFCLLFKLWDSYGKDAAKRIYLNFNESHNLPEMLETFKSIEEYEKCAKIRDWIEEIQFLEKNDCVNSSKLNL
jgi:hypothetical protein